MSRGYPDYIPTISRGYPDYIRVGISMAYLWDIYGTSMGHPLLYCSRMIWDIDK
jgi:hypothetical protein